MNERTSIRMTESAVGRLMKMITAKGNPGLMLRVYVQGGGCSGFQYGFQFEETVAEDDIQIEHGEVRVLVDTLSLQYLSGAEIDFLDDLMGSRFVVNNPNAETTCGCGSSFSI